ncbi:MAG: helix-turn-helix domain-containing protein [Methanocellales archaeon]|nr:helix-turn-helix domain-containing protein [Methanocellales archaeon]
MDSAQLLDILGNENRRRILQLLSHKPCYVSEIADRLSVGPKAILDHLDMLERAGLIECSNEQRRKYFHIAGNVQLEVSVSPHLYGVETNPIMISVEEQRRLRQEYSSMALLNLNDELRRLHSLRRELMLAQRSIQARIAELMNLCAEMIDQIISDHLEAEILLALLTGTRRVEMLSEELNIPANKIDKGLHQLKEKGMIIERQKKWYIR